MKLTISMGEFSWRLILVIALLFTLHYLKLWQFMPDILDWITESDNIKPLVKAAVLSPD